MDSKNMRLLGIYYSVQKVLDNNLAAPMGKGLKLPLNAVENDHERMAERTLPFLKKGVSLDKLTDVISKVFSNIESGDISPDQYLGQDFTLEKTVDQFEKHDAFIHVYGHFMEELSNTTQDIQKSVIDTIIKNSLKLDLNSSEAIQLKAMFSEETNRAPLTLEIEDLREIVDTMYEATCDAVGPMDTDKYLSRAVKKANNNTEFDSTTFL